MRRLIQDVLRRLDVDGVYLTPDQARRLCRLAQWGWRASTSPEDREVLRKLERRVAELEN